MKSSDLDKRLGAYLDGALVAAKRARLERDLEQDPALQRQLARSRALSQLVREAWTEGPPAPASEVLISALRPQLAAISRERRARPTWQQALEQVRLRLSTWFGPMPLATSAVAAFLLALAFLPRAGGSIPEFSALLPTPGAASFQASPVTPSALPPNLAGQASAPFAPVGLWQHPAAGIYDVAPREAPAMLFHNADGSTILWLLEDDDLSLLIQRMDRWG